MRDLYLTKHYYFLSGRLEALDLGPTMGWIVSQVTSLTQTVEDRILTQDPIRSFAGLDSCRDRV